MINRPIKKKIKHKQTKMYKCLLCLGQSMGASDFIKVNSSKWHELDIANVLEKHFWTLDTTQTNSWLCLSCWEEVNNFHKFYLRIKHCHTNFVQIEIEGESNYELLVPKLEIIDENSGSTNDLLEPQFAENNYKLEEFANNLSDSVGLEKYYENSDYEQYTSSSKGSQQICIEDENFLAERIKKITCDICNVLFANFTDMRKHFSTIHDQKGYLICCNRKYYERFRFVDHLRCHINPEYFKCKQCGKIMSDRKIFKNHMANIHRPNNSVPSLFCEICKKYFKRVALLRKHKLNHLPDNEKKFSCTYCGKLFAKFYILNQHIQYVHEKKTYKTCHICDKALKCSSDYKKHMDKHEGKPQPKISCDVCGLRLANKIGLTRHKNTQHPIGGKQEHPCPLCPKASPTYGSLRKHIKSMHEKGHDHKCSICEKAFRRAELLREHMAFHTRTPLYTCSWCPKTFNSNASMNAHRKKKHPKEWAEAKLQKYAENLPEELKAQILNNKYIKKNKNKIVHSKKL